MTTLREAAQQALEALENGNRTWEAIRILSAALSAKQGEQPEQKPVAWPEGYEPHELPADYTGKLWIEGQVRYLYEATLKQPEPEDFAADAHRLAMELECLLLSTKDTAALSRWWDSAHDALEQHRQLVKEAYGEPIEKTSGSPLRCRKCGGSLPVSYDETRTGQCNCMEHAHPPRREWRGLTEEEIDEISDRIERSDFFDIVIPFARAIEQALKEKNYE